MEQGIRITESARNIRRMARIALKGHWKTAILAYVLNNFLLSGPVILLRVILGESGAGALDSAPLDASQWIVALYPLIIDGPLLLGLSAFFLAVARSEKHDLGMILSGFGNFTRATCLFLLLVFFMVLWLMLPFSLLTAALSSLSASAPVFTGALFALLFLIVVTVFMLTYAQAFFLFADDPQLGTRALGLSRRMMRGYKGKLFCLAISFAGWYLVPFIVCCAFVYLSALPPQQTLSPEIASAVAYTTAGQILPLIVSLLFVPVSVYSMTSFAIFCDILTGRRRPISADTGFGASETWRPLSGNADGGAREDEDGDV
ncbi:MAG: DUF975 family protein [Clostridiales Family XIII bacterium]|nr:DUF975 family protein [Clostridiales Family XIII bacterium]